MKKQLVITWFLMFFAIGGASTCRDADALDKALPSKGQALPLSVVSYPNHSLSTVALASYNGPSFWIDGRCAREEGVV